MKAPCSARLWNDSPGFARALARKMGISVRFPHENRTKLQFPSVGAAERAKIERLYPLDLDLYEWQLLHYDADEASDPDEADFDFAIPAWRANLFNQARAALFAHAGR